LGLRELVEVVDRLIRLRSRAFAFFDRIQKIPGAAIVEEKDPLSKTPRIDFLRWGFNLAVMRAESETVMRERVGKLYSRSKVISVSFWK
jgi:hypothetical protein